MAAERRPRHDAGDGGHWSTARERGPTAAAGRHGGGGWGVETGTASGRTEAEAAEGGGMQRGRGRRVGASRQDLVGSDRTGRGSGDLKLG